MDLKSIATGVAVALLAIWLSNNVSAIRSLVR